MLSWVHLVNRRGGRFLVRVESSCFSKHVWLVFADSKDKISKLNIFYSLASTQGILVVLNNGISTSSSTPFVTHATSSTPSPAPPIKSLAYICEVDKLANIASIFGGTNLIFCFNKEGLVKGITVFSNWVFSKVDSGHWGKCFLGGDSLYKDTIYILFSSFPHFWGVCFYIFDVGFIIHQESP